MMGTDGKPARRLAERLYRAMLAEAGPRGWWPRDRAGARGGRDEIAIGAVLTQNTAWTNVEKALATLAAAGLVDLEKIATMEPAELAPYLKTAGYFNIKARRLSAVARFFAPEGRERFAELDAMPDEALRAALLAVHGVGAETCDSILLYAFGRASFVIDAYTLRIGRRHGLFPAGTKYEAARAWFMRHVKPEVEKYNEYHALLVYIGNRYCKPRPRCVACPLFRPGFFSCESQYREMNDVAILDARP